MLNKKCGQFNVLQFMMLIFWIRRLDKVVPSYKLLFNVFELHQDFFQKKFIDEENSTIIHNGIDYEHIGNLPSERNEFLKSINCPFWKSKTLIGTISRLSPEKGITNLLSAFSEVIEKEVDLRLIIIGGYPEEHENYYLKINQLIEEKRLTQHVRILGYQENALNILKCFDIYVSPSLSEGLPISVLEALASKIPTVATEITGNKDILRNSLFGVLVKPESSNSLARGITKMIQLTKAERDILSTNAYNRIKKHFSADEMASKTTLLYNQVLK